MIVRVTRRDVERPAGAAFLPMPEGSVSRCRPGPRIRSCRGDDSNRPVSLGEDAGSSPEALLEFEITRAQGVLVPSREQTPTADTKNTSVVDCLDAVHDHPDTRGQVDDSVVRVRSGAGEASAARSGRREVGRTGDDLNVAQFVPARVSPGDGLSGAREKTARAVHAVFGERIARAVFGGENRFFHVKAAL
jgi:hypothetical protein